MTIQSIQVPPKGGFFSEAVVYALQECDAHDTAMTKRYEYDCLLGDAIEGSAMKHENLWGTTALYSGAMALPTLHSPV